MNTIPTFLKSAVLLRPEITIVPAAGTKNPNNAWREQAKLGKPAMFYSVQGEIAAGDATVRVTVNNIACKIEADGSFHGLGLEQEGADEHGNPLPQSQVSAFQADHCAKFHVEGGEIVFDEEPIITADGTPFDFAYGVKHLVYRAAGKTLRLDNLRLEFKDDPRYATGLCESYAVVDEPRPEAKGAVRRLTLQAPKTVSYNADRQAARAAKTAVPEDISL